MRIRYYREKLGMTQDDLAELLKVDHVTISRHENGSREPSIDKFKILSEVFNVSIDEITENPIATPLTDGDIKFAVFGDPDVTDGQFEEIKRRARIIWERDEQYYRHVVSA